MATLAEVAAQAATCTKCDLASTRTQVVFGRVNERSPLMIVGEAPGKDEDEQGEPFVGRSGKLLDQVMLEEMGVTRSRVSIVNTVMCRPPGNRDPQAAEIAACNEWLEAKLERIAPKVVITLGNFATRLLLFGDPAAKQGITRLRGQSYPWRNGAVLVPTFHPAAVLRRCEPTSSAPSSRLPRRERSCEARDPQPGGDRRLRGGDRRRSPSR